MIYAVDVDGTLFEEKWPELGRPNIGLINFLKLVRSKGDKVILWTLREDDDLDYAVRRCAEHGLEFDAVNDNLPEVQKMWGNNPRKVAADFYIDDRNMAMIGSFTDEES